ncbi:hypothetical protein ACROYT_G007692 [Oculina patagonica]
MASIKIDDLSSVKPFDPHGDPSSVGRRWQRWIKSVALYGDSKGLIIQADKDDNKVQRRDLLLHSAGEEVEEIFETLADTVACGSIPNVPPVAQPVRRTPFSLRDKVKEKIEELVAMDIIYPVEGPTPWVSLVVVVPKQNDEIRFCVDMRRANEAIIRERYPIPTVDEVLQNLNKSTVFSKLDLRFHMTQMVFMGLVLTNNGIGPAKDKVKAIVDAREPHSASEVRSFLGLANYNAQFIPDFATVAEPLRRLTIKKGVRFEFGDE